MLIWAYSLIINKINRNLHSIYWKLFVISSNNQVMYKLLFILFIIKLKIWKQITRGFKNDENLYLKRILLVRIISKYWTKTLIENTTNSQNLSYLNRLSYKKQLNTFCWKANHKRALFDITSTWFYYYFYNFTFAVETYLYSSTYLHIRF